MALNDLWKKFIRDEEEGGDESATYYRPRKRAEVASLVDEPDDDMFRTPARPSRTMSDYDAENDLGVEDPIDEDEGKPRFKRVMATGMKSAENAVDLMCRKFVVLVNTDDVSDEMLTPFQCYLAGAIQATNAHLTPLDDENFFISIEPFDASPYLPHDEQDALEEQEDDLI